LYVVDSVARSWLEQAIKAGQTPGPAAADGTYAAGVNHIAELLPSFMSDIINTAPEEHKVSLLDALLSNINRMAVDGVKKLHHCTRGHTQRNNFYVFGVILYSITHVFHAIRPRLRNLSISGSAAPPSPLQCSPASRKS
jgi:hypothetical protein